MRRKRALIVALCASTAWSAGAPVGAWAGAGVAGRTRSTVACTIPSCLPPTRYKVTPTVLSFGTVEIGKSSASQAITVTNTSQIIPGWYYENEPSGPAAWPYDRHSKEPYPGYGGVAHTDFVDVTPTGTTGKECGSSVYEAGTVQYPYGVLHFGIGDSCAFYVEFRPTHAGVITEQFFVAQPGYPNVAQPGFSDVVTVVTLTGTGSATPVTTATPATTESVEIAKLKEMIQRVEIYGPKVVDVSALAEGLLELSAKYPYHSVIHQDLFEAHYWYLEYLIEFTHGGGAGRDGDQAQAYADKAFTAIAALQRK